MLSGFESAVISDAWPATGHHRGQPARLTALLMGSEAPIRLVAIRVVSMHGEKEARGPWRPYAPGLGGEFLARAAPASSDDAAAVEIRGHPKRWFVCGRPCSSQGRVGGRRRPETSDADVGWEVFSAGASRPFPARPEGATLPPGGPHPGPRGELDAGKEAKGRARAPNPSSGGIEFQMSHAPRSTRRRM